MKKKFEYKYNIPFSTPMFHSEKLEKYLNHKYNKVSDRIKNEGFLNYTDNTVTKGFINLNNAMVENKQKQAGFIKKYNPLEELDTFKYFRSNRFIKDFEKTYDRNASNFNRNKPKEKQIRSFREYLNDYDKMDNGYKQYRKDTEWAITKNLKSVKSLVEIKKLMDDHNGWDIHGSLKAIKFAERVFDTWNYLDYEEEINKERFDRRREKENELFFKSKFYGPKN